MSHPNLHPLQLTSITFDHRLSGDPLQVVVKCFSLPEPSTPCSPDAFTLLVTIGIGSSSEVWIPTIKRLFDLQSRSHARIAQIWTIDAQNHGDAAVLNDHVLKEHFSDHDQVLQQYSVAVHRLLSSGLIGLNGSKIIGIGHSAGCGALALSIPETEPIPYHGLILIEPALLHHTVGVALEDMARRNRPLLMKRPDVWATKEEAIAWMSGRRPWKTWHPEVMQAIHDFGLRDLPTADHPDETGVTSKQYKGQEAVSFFSSKDNFKSVDRLGRFCSSIPVHVIWGDRKDFLPKNIQDILTDPRERRMASISVVPDGGHWVLQEKPAEVSKLVFKALESMTPKKANL